MRERLPHTPAVEQGPSHDDPHLKDFEEAIRRAYDHDTVPEALVAKAGRAFSRDARHTWEVTMSRVNDQVTREYETWKHKMIKTAQVAGISLIGLTGAQHLIESHDAAQRDPAAEHIRIRETASTRAALTRALEELPPGPIRAVVQTDIERAYGAFADGNWSVPKDVPTFQDQDAEQAVVRFQRMLVAVEDGSAEDLKRAVEAYAQAVAHLSDERRDKVEHTIMQWHAE